MIMASTKPTEAEYTDAMGRHGTPEWTADDQRTAERWLAREDAEPDTVAEVAAKPERPARGR